MRSSGSRDPTQLWNGCDGYGTVATVATVSKTRGDASPQGSAAPGAPRGPRRHGASALPRGPRAWAGGHLAPEERRFATAFGVHAPVMPVLIRHLFLCALFLCARPPGGEPQRAALPAALRAWAGRRRPALARRQRCSVATLPPRAAGAFHAPRGELRPNGGGVAPQGGAASDSRGNGLGARLAVDQVDCRCPGWAVQSAEPLPLAPAARHCGRPPHCPPEARLPRAPASLSLVTCRAPPPPLLHFPLPHALLYTRARVTLTGDL